MDPATAKMAAQLATNLLRNRGVRYVLVGLLLLTLGVNLSVVFGPWILATQMAATLRSQQQATTDGGSCADPAGISDATSPSAGSLNSEQVGNARVIYTVALQSRAGDRGGVVGIATALQESGLRNLSYGDRDSVGLFQQRASWGSIAVRMSPTQSAQMFYAALLKVPGWTEMPVTRAAQAVQRSASRMRTPSTKKQRPAWSRCSGRRRRPVALRGWLRSGRRCAVRLGRPSVRLREWRSKPV